MSLANYWTPDYFAPSYFPPLVSASGPLPATEPGYRDRDAYAAIAAGLQATGEFACVLLGQAIETNPVSPDQLPLALIVPGEWVEEDDVDPTVNLRQVSYSLILWVRDEDPAQRYQKLDLLTSIAQNAIDGSDLNGGCLRNLTKLRRGRFDNKPRQPEQNVTLKGSFSYLVATHTGHDSTE